MEAQIAFYAECHKHMCDLQYDLATGSSLDKMDNFAHTTNLVTAGMEEISLASPIDELPRSQMGSEKKRARVLFDYDAQNGKEISLKSNEIVFISHPSDVEPDWRLAENAFTKGLVPLAYLEIFD